MTNCIYCGLHNPASREHVVQDALGGVDVLNNVCKPCNELFAINDKVLAVNSPLSIFARRELNGYGLLTWDIDHGRRGLLKEARPTPGSDSVTLVPQIIFDGNEQILYFHSEDLIELGRTEIQNRFYTRLRRAFSHYRIYGPDARKRDHKGQDMLKFERVDRIRSGFRLPPRIFCNESMPQFGPKAIMFKMRYLTEGDRQRTLDILSKLDWTKRASGSGMQLGSTEPIFHLNYCLTHAIQALTKIGLNLLAFFCSSTLVNLNTFKRAVEWVREGKHNREFGDENKLGFINPSDIAELACPPKSHKFRLVHEITTHKWKLYASFFEGKIAAYVAFDGPNHERWSTMDVIAPYDKPILTPQYDSWYRPIDTHVVLTPPEIVPSIPWKTGEMIFRRDPI